MFLLDILGLIILSTWVPMGSFLFKVAALPRNLGRGPMENDDNEDNIILLKITYRTE